MTGKLSERQFSGQLLTKSCWRNELARLFGAEKFLDRGAGAQTQDAMFTRHQSVHITSVSLLVHITIHKRDPSKICGHQELIYVPQAPTKRYTSAQHAIATCGVNLRLFCDERLTLPLAQSMAMLLGTEADRLTAQGL